MFVPSPLYSLNKIFFVSIRLFGTRDVHSNLHNGEHIEFHVIWANFAPKAAGECPLRCSSRVRSLMK